MKIGRGPQLAYRWQFSLRAEEIVKFMPVRLYVLSLSLSLEFVSFLYFSKPRLSKYRFIIVGEEEREEKFFPEIFVD